MTSTVIKPTVGRKVWYRPSKHDQQGPVPMQCAVGHPLDATVIAVHGDRLVNVLVTDMVGRQFPVLSVTLVQKGDILPACNEGFPLGRYVEWMPYQKSQAAKTEVAGTPRPDNPTAEAADFLASVKACDLSGDAPCDACQ